jgi:hypothetical protein
MQSFNIENQINVFIDSLGRMFKPRRLIGLALEEGAILVADMRWEKDRFIVSKAKCFVFPEDISLMDPEKLGMSLGTFLQENGFAAKKAIVGIPAKWLMIREKVIPVSTKETVIGILKIYAEREFTLSPEELALDYTGAINYDKPSRLYLLAMMKSNLDRAILAVRWAGRDVLSVTASSAVLFSIMCSEMSAPVPRYLLYLRKGYAELLERDGGQLVDIRHIQRDLKGETDAFITELRRILSCCQDSPAKEAADRILIWNASGDPYRNELKQLGESLPSNKKIMEPDNAFVDKLSLTAGEDSHRMAAAIMLGRGFNNADPFYLDFLNSHMHVKHSMIKRNQILWAAALTTGIMIVFLTMLLVWRADKRDVSELKAKLSGMTADIESAKQMIQKVNIAAGWYSERPRILECLTELTTIFPEEGSIWVTNLALTEEMNGVVSGRARDEKSVIDILDKLKGNSLFSNVQMIYLQDNGKISGEVSFSMNFYYAGKE